MSEPAHDTDPFESTRALFEIPDGTVYLDGNSLGPLPRAARRRVEHEMTANWGEQLIAAWNTAGWIDLPSRVGDKIADLIGAPAGSVLAADSTSVNLFKVLSAALELRPDRPAVLSDTGNFPTDLYVAQGLVSSLGSDRELRLVEPEQVADAIADDVAVVMLTQVDYRTGRLHDIDALTAAAHEVGALVIWDLAHSAGAMPVDVTLADADFAVGCGYKYLNGGPGAPAYAYVAPRLADQVHPALVGWLGHEAPFAFDTDYRPAPGVMRLTVGTPSILAMAALDAALDAWEGVDLAEVRARSIELSERFVAEVEAACPEFELASPRDPAARGSHVSFRSPNGYAIVQAAIDRGVVGDFRMPDMMRFGFTPLYLGIEDVVHAARVIGEIVSEGAWDRPEYRQRSKVT